LLSEGTRTLTTILRQTFANPDKDTPLLPRRTSGNDHTGVITGLLLTLCGFLDETVVEEYNLLEYWFREKIDEISAIESANQCLGKRSMRESLVSFFPSPFGRIGRETDWHSWW